MIRKLSRRVWERILLSFKFNYFILKKKNFFNTVMLSYLKKLGIPVYTQKIVSQIKSRDLSKEEKKVIYIKNYSNDKPIEDQSIEVNEDTYLDFIKSKETDISINVLQVDKTICYNKINDSINNQNYFKKTFSDKLTDKQLSNLKQSEVLVTKMSKKHPVNFIVEDSKYIAQSSFTKGDKELKLNYTIDQSGITITKFLIYNPNSYKNQNKVNWNKRNLSIVEVRSKPAYNVNTAIIETPMFNRYKLTNTFDIETVLNEKDKLFIKNVMNNYNVKDSKNLGEKIREEFYYQKFIHVNDEFSSINQHLQQIVEGDVIKNRYNKPVDYCLVEGLLNDILKN